MNIYATLVVRLANSGQFKKAEMWRNTALFRDERGGLCGLLLHRIEEGRGELVLFFGKDTQGKTKQQFEGYVSAHLKRKSVPGSWSKKRHYTCQVCYTPLTDLQVERRKARGFSFIECNVCGSEISLLDSPDEVVDATDVGDIVSEMNRTADTRRDQDAASASLAGKIATNDFDVFLAHNSKDKHAVQLISEELKHRGIYPWLDVEQVPPGQWFQDGIQRAIPKVKSVAIILGPHGIGKWEETEMRAFLSRAVKRQMPVIPVLLPGHRAFPRKLSFLAELNWVEFASLQDAKSYDRLVWGITARSMTASRGRRKKPSMDS